MQEVGQRRSSCRGNQTRTCPAFTLVVFADQFQQAERGGVDVGRQFGDAIFQLFDVLPAQFGTGQVGLVEGGGSGS
jgi:hypothetical protein